jgi:REP element-mobilizing transposase RayT
MKINYVNPEHVHVLIDLPTSLSIEDVMQLLKGAPPIGLMKAISCRASLDGAEATVHFP